MDSNLSEKLSKQHTNIKKLSNLKSLPESMSEDFSNLHQKLSKPLRCNDLRLKSDIKYTRTFDQRVEKISRSNSNPNSLSGDLQRHNQIMKEREPVAKNIDLNCIN